MKKHFQFTFILFVSLSLSSCASYYQRFLEFNSTIETGDVVKADELLSKDTKSAEGKNRLLYFMNKGTLEMLRVMNTSMMPTFSLKIIEKI